VVTPTFPLITVRGDAYALGRQHGEQAASLVARYLVLIERLTGKPRDVLCQHALRYLPAMQALSGRFVEEVRGLADGAGISWEEALLCQVRHEAGPGWEGGCTAFALRGAATADGQALVGQNQDLQPEFSDVSILVRIEPSDGRPKALMYTFAGQLGYFGMNAYGVCNYANSVYNFRWQPGLAHYPLKRAILEQHSVADCIALFREHRTCSAANIVLGDGQGQIASLEVRHEGVALYHGAHPDGIVHTNHYLSDEFSVLETGSLPDTFPRHQRMSTLIRQHWGQITVETLKGFLADHDGDPAGICRHGAVDMHTTSGHIAEPQKGLLHVRRGHGCLGSWETYDVR
jgi:isopenicillin-N N-acyltransferase like protein